MALTSDKADPRAIIKLAFDVYDIDGDGGLSQEELSRFLSYAGFSGYNLGDLFNELDKNHNGRVSHSQFESFCLANPCFISNLTDKFKGGGKRGLKEAASDAKTALSKMAAVASERASDDKIIKQD